MKTTLFTGLLTLTACKKNFVCQCTRVYTEPAYFSETTGEYHDAYTFTTSFTNTYKAKKNEGESFCAASNKTESFASPYDFDGQGPTTQITSCELK